MILKYFPSFVWHPGGVDGAGREYSWTSIHASYRLRESEQGEGRWASLWIRDASFLFSAKIPVRILLRVSVRNLLPPGQEAGSPQRGDKRTEWMIRV